MKYFTLCLFICCLTTPLSANELKPFTTDGCSIFPDGTLKHKDLWLKCCTSHDKAYWKGGIYEQRLKADQELKDCVASVGLPNLAKLILAGVRVGGSPYFPTQFRWGYGWPFPRGYKALSEEELHMVQEALKAAFKKQE